MISYVLDASVAAKWFLPSASEPYAPKAMALLADYSSARCRFMVPDLFWPEIGNILWKAVRLRRLHPPALREVISTLDQSGIATAPCGPLLKDAITIAHTFDRTVYDAMYVALAVRTNAPLITADERLANALADRFPIRWLGAR